MLENITHFSSPNCNARPAGTIIDTIVIHGISLPPGEFTGDAIIDLFMNRLDSKAHPYFTTIANLQVSAHILIRRNGAIFQFVPFEQRAWHAGNSIFQGRENCNDFSIGIELEGTDDVPYEQIQYQQLACLVSSLQKAYPAITNERIIGHSDIAPGRKTDPGPAFDWEYLRELLKFSGNPY